MRLFCFSYAGGSADVFNSWKPYLDKRITMVPVEIAGRGRRINEKFHKSIKEAAQDVYYTICRNLDDRPYILFGHSMGTMILYELLQNIQGMKNAEPKHVFVSAGYPPHVKREEKRLHDLEPEEFKEEILKVGGTSREVFESMELSDIFIPILRSDYRMVEEYEYTESSMRIKCGITVLNGKYDAMEAEDMLEWEKYTSGSCKMYEFEGGHFFIKDHVKEIVGIINKTTFDTVL